MSVSSRTRTGIAREDALVSRPIRVKRTPARFSVSASITASGSGARSGTRVTPTTGSSTSCERAPERPRVDIGPKAYKVYHNGSRKVIRFFVAQPFGRRKNFFVFDMDSTGRYAGKTKKDGYPTKEEAVKVARTYRDRYGAYTRCPF